MVPNLTAYPTFKKSYSLTELEQCFTPTFEEKLLVEEHIQSDSPAHPLIFMLLLKCYQCVGRPVALKKIPKVVSAHVAQKMDLESELLQQYPVLPRNTKQRYLAHIRHYLGINTNELAREKLMEDTINTYVKIRNDVADIINAVLDVLIKSYFELPSLRQLERQVKSQLHQANEIFYQSVDQQLDEKAKAAINLLLKQPSKGTPSEWFRVKQEIAQPTLKKTKVFIQNFQKLVHLKTLLPVTVDFIPPTKLTTFYHEAASIDADMLKQMKSHKRYALVALYVNHKVALTLDDFCKVLTRWAHQIHHGALELLNQYRIDHAGETDEMIDTLHSMLKTLKTDKSSADKVNQLLNDLPTDEDIDSMMEKCEQHQVYSDNNYYPFALKLYRNKRAGLFDLLEQLDLKATYPDSSLLRAVKTIIRNRHCTKKYVSLTSHHQDTYRVSLNLIPEKIKRVAVDKVKEAIHKHYYELGIVSVLIDEINCGDIFVPHAYDFNDPNLSLISQENFDDNVDHYCHITQLKKDKKAFVHLVQHLLSHQAETTDQHFPDNDFLHIVKQKPYIKKTKTKEQPPTLGILSEAIDRRMTPITIIDVIRDVDQWIGLSQTLKTASGQKIIIDDSSERFAATLYAYGCNVGPVQTAFSLKQFSRKQVASLFNYYLTEPRIEAMITRVVNYYSRFVLPKYWGDGSSVSVDGTYWEMYTSNLLAAHHIRYGKYGGLGYYHVSDQYIALYSNFLTCGVHEGSYLIDGIIDNQSHIQPHIVHGDTDAQSEIVFALCFLLGIKLMPRIKRFKHLKYYKAYKAESYEYINEIFTSSAIDWNKIENDYYAMLRVAMSIQQGKIKASTILRRFNSKNKKNKLYYAMRELGRAIRTKYLLHYIDDVETRKMVHAGTCKSEEFNNFLDWVAFGNNKVIRDNRKNAQQKIIKCGHLVANIVMTHVVVTMTRAINVLQAENYPVEETLLKHFSPFRTSHINRLGVFVVDKNRQIGEPEFDLIK